MTEKQWAKYLEVLCEKVVIRLPYNFSAQDKKDLTQQAILYVLTHPNISQITDNLPLTQHQENTLRCIIRRNLYPHIRKMIGDRTIGYTNLGLVSRSSLPIIQRVLRNHPLLKEYILAYQCFNEVKTSQNVHVNKLTNEHFELMGDRYHYLADYPRINALIIKQYLEDIGRQIRLSQQEQNQYLKDIVQPIRPEQKSYLTEAEQQFDLPSHHTETTSELLEIREKLFTLLDLINTEFLPKLKLRIMILYHYYGLNITQKKIAQNLNIQQYQVSREINRAKTNIFTQMCKYYDISTGEITKERLEQLDILLEEYYRLRLFKMLHYSIEILPKLLITPWEPLLYLTDRIVGEFEQKFNHRINPCGHEQILIWIRDNLQYI